MRKQIRYSKTPLEAPYKQLWKYWWPLVVILTITFGLYRQVSDFDLINYDDNRYVTDNKDVRDLSVEGLKRIFISPQYKEEIIPPLTILSLAVNYHYGGLNGGSYHMTNLIFHLLNIVLVLVLVYKLTKHQVLSLFVAAVFAFHPSATEAVAWVAARKEVQ
jgi:protein O-mannosyl-transferase